MQELGGHSFLEVDPTALTALTTAAIRDVSHLFRPGHLQQLASIHDGVIDAGDEEDVKATSSAQRSCCGTGAARGAHKVGVGSGLRQHA